MPKGSAATDWVLFLDESGDFGDPGASVCIAGILLQDRHSPAIERTLRTALERIAPDAPYPPHATDLNLEAFYLASWMLAAMAKRDLHPERHALAAAAAAIDRDAFREPLQSFIASVRAGDLPSYETLQGCGAWLRVHRPHEYQALAAIRERADAAYRDLLRRVGEVYGPQRCAVVAAVDRPARELTAEPPPAADRFLALLSALLERVFALLRSRPPAAHTVWVRAAVRDVRVMPHAIAMPLRADDVARCVRAAERFPLDPPAGPVDAAVRLVADVPARYDANVHPGIVLADYVSNRLRRPLADDRPWADLVHYVGRATGLSPAIPARIAPTLDAQPAVAITGAAQRAIAQAFGATSTEPDLASIRAGWPRQQAASWIEVARTIRPRVEVGT